MSELKPCPFCGGKGRLKSYISGKWKKKAFYYAECSVCGVRTALSYVLGEAVEAWNRRTEDGK